MLKNDIHVGGFCAKKFYTTEAAFLNTILACNLLTVCQAQVTAKEGWRKPSKLRAAVFASRRPTALTALRLPAAGCLARLCAEPSWGELDVNWCCDSRKTGVVSRCTAP